MSETFLILRRIERDMIMDFAFKMADTVCDDVCCSNISVYNKGDNEVNTC
jgi:hypothetical protein